MRRVVLIAVLACAPAQATAAAAHRQLASVGCDNCCFKNDCSLAFSQTTPGVCCGAHPYSSRRQTGCCPMGATCVACGHIWKCTRSTYVSRSGRCSMCRDDQVRECLYHHSYGGYYGHGSSAFLSMMLLMFAFCALASCFFYGRSTEPDAVYVQNGQMVGGPGYGGPVMMHPGYGYDPMGGVAGGAATGFVGGMLVGEMLDHGHYGGMGYGGMGMGGYGGDMGMGGGGDMGFGADQ